MRDDDAIRRAWRRMAGGDREAFASLYAATADALLAYGRCVEADAELVADVTQELYLGLWRRGATLPTPDSVPAYLLRSLRNNLTRARRRRDRYAEVDLDGLLSEIGGVAAPPRDEAAEDTVEGLLHKVGASLPDLPPGQREVVNLRYYQGLSNAEIAEVLGVKPQSVANQLARAIKNLRARHR